MPPSVLLIHRTALGLLMECKTRRLNCISAYIRMISSNRTICGDVSVGSHHQFLRNTYRPPTPFVSTETSTRVSGGNYTAATFSPSIVWKTLNGFGWKFFQSSPLSPRAEQITHVPTQSWELAPLTGSLSACNHRDFLRAKGAC